MQSKTRQCLLETMVLFTTNFVLFIVLLVMAAIQECKAYCNSPNGPCGSIAYMASISGCTPMIPNYEPQGTFCGESNNVCKERVCNGSSINCPSISTNKAVGTVCGTETGECLLSASTCDGSGSCSILPVYKALGVTCTTGTGETGNCSGDSGECSSMLMGECSEDDECLGDDMYCDAICIAGDCTAMKHCQYKVGEGEPCDRDEHCLAGGCLGEGVCEFMPSASPTISAVPSASPTTSAVPSQMPTATGYVGCFRDDPNARAMDVLLAFGLWKADCFSQCSTLGYNFAGLQDGRACFCGNAGYDIYGPSDRCTKPCSMGDVGTCGGWSANEVYNLNEVLII